MNSLIAPRQALELLLSRTHSLVDVRSEGEFAKAAIPGSHNSPILNDAERHAVGLCYKQKGQTDAIALGHALVDPQRNQRVARWTHLGESSPNEPLLVTCWRGGMRSQFATEWIQEAGRSAMRVEGGYKALRAELMAELLQPRRFFILSGRTGSGKTELLKALPIADKIDIEDLAAHRGSSFGKLSDRDQPSQATFENALALGLWQKTKPIVLEDESKVIGKLHLPEALYRSMVSSPIIQLEVSLAERCLTIFQDYVAEPYQKYSEPRRLEGQLIESVAAIKRRLGGALTDKISRQIREAFLSEEPNFDDHRNWIESLLVEYYDRTYEHSSERNQRNIAFKGNYEECKAWICNQYV